MGEQAKPWEKYGADEPVEEESATAKPWESYQDNTQAKPDFFERTGDRLGERFSRENLLPKVTNTMDIGPNGELKVPDHLSNALQLTGEAAWGGWDVLGEVMHEMWDGYTGLPGAEGFNENVVNLATPAVESYANSSMGQKVGDIVFQGLEAWESFAESNPKQARNAEAAAGILLWANPTTKTLPAGRQSGSVLRWMDDVVPVKPKPLEVGGPVRGGAQGIKSAIGQPSKVAQGVGTAIRKSGLKASQAKKNVFVQKLVEPHNLLADTTRVGRTQQAPGPMGRLITEPSVLEAAAAKEVMLTGVKPSYSLTKNAHIIGRKADDLGKTLQKGLAYEARLGRQQSAATRRTTNVGGIKVVEQPAGVPRGHYARQEIDQLLDASMARVMESPFAAGSDAAVRRVYSNFLKSVDDGQGTLQDLFNARVKFDQVYRAEFAKLARKQNGAMLNETAINQSVMQLRADINSFIADRVGSAAVKDTLRRQSALYRARDTIWTKAAHEGRNRITRTLQGLTRSLHLRDTSLQFYMAGQVAATTGAAIAGSPALLAGSIIPGTLYLGGKLVGAPGTRKLLGKLIQQMDVAIKRTTDPALIQKLRLDRAAILEMARGAEEYQEKEEQ